MNERSHGPVENKNNDYASITHGTKQPHSTRDTLINCFIQRRVTGPTNYPAKKLRGNNIHIQLSTLEKYKNRNSYGGRTRSVETSAKF